MIQNGEIGMKVQKDGIEIGQSVNKDHRADEREGDGPE